jgi:hypothetical protein
MTITVANTNTTNTFDYWRNRTNELAVAMSSNAVTVGGSVAVGNAVVNGSITANVFTGYNSITTSGTLTQVIDSYLITAYRTVEYTINISDNNANNHYASKIFTTHDGTIGYSTEYAQITTNTAVGVINVASNATSIILNYTPSLTGTTVKFAKVAV